MAFQYSKAEVFVDNVIKAGVSVVNETVQSNRGYIDQSIIFDFHSCSGAKFGEIDLKQDATLDIQGILKVFSSTDIDGRVESAMKGQATAEALGGMGVQNSTSEVVMNQLTDLSRAIVNNIKAINDQSIVQTQKYSCSGPSGGLEIRAFDVHQTATVIARQVTQANNVTKIKQEIVDTIDADATAKTKGWDPTFVVLAIVAAVCVFTFGGIGFAGKTITSPKFLVLVSAVATFFGIYVLLSSWIGTWPSKKVDEIVDSDAVIAQKKKTNAQVRVGAAVVTGILGVITIGLGVYAAKAK